MYRDNTSITANLNYSSIMFSMINYAGTTRNTLMFYEQFQQILSHLLLKVSCLYYVKMKTKINYDQNAAILLNQSFFTLRSLPS